MLKDPNHHTETPYELLGLAFEAPLEEVRKALPRFMRDKRKIGRLGQAQEAVRKLQSAAARASIDIWLYDVDMLESNEVQNAPSILDLDEFRHVPAAPPEALYCDLEGADFSSDFRGIDFLKVRISDVRTFDGTDGIRFLSRFER